MNVRILVLALLCMGVAGCGEAPEALAAIKEQTQVHTLKREAERLHDQGQTEQAIAKFEAVVLNPAATEAQKADSLRYISLGYYELGDYPRSGEYAAKAAALYPEGSYDYLVNMADADLMLDRVPEAVVRLEQAFALAPRQLAVNNVLGLVYLGDNGAEYIDYRKALGYNKAAFEIAPGRITEIVLARNYLALEEYALAEEHLAALSQRYTEDAYVRDLLAEAQTGLEQSQE